jgi:hypothetical protein
MRKAVLVMLASLFLAIPAEAALVQVEVTGQVEYNFLRAAPLNEAQAGDPVSLKFQVDSNVFMDSTSFPTRGYNVILESFSFTAGPATVGATNPAPYGQIPYFVLRNNDPAVDGFFVSGSNVDFPFPGISTDTYGICGLIESHWDVSYPEDRLDSLDILDALGTYDYEGLSRYYFPLVDCGFEAMSVAFEQMTISLVPVEVPVDIKPGSCPNPFQAVSRGLLPVAILGTEDLDVSTIDPASIRLNGVAPLRSGYEDVGTPFEPYTGKESCALDCSDWEGDGLMDMTLKFDRQDLVDALGGPPDDNECLVLTLTGNFYEEYGGGPIIGEDVIGYKNRGPGQGIDPMPADRFVPVQQPSNRPSSPVEISR